MQNKILAIVGTTIILAAVIVAIWQFAPAFSGNPQISDRTIKIGLVAPLSTAIGQDMDRAARMAIEEINNAGGIYVEEWHANALITLVTADTINDAPDNALPPVRRAILEDNLEALKKDFYNE